MFHLVRRLRARFDYRRLDPGPLGAFPSSPHRMRQMSGIGLLVQDPDLLCVRSPWVQLRARPDAAVATGAAAANRELHYIGISGDGDSLFVGLGQMSHAIRRNVRMLYVIENNGVYGLTKDSFPPRRMSDRS